MVIPSPQLSAPQRVHGKGEFRAALAIALATSRR